VSVPIAAITSAQSKRGMSGAQAVLGVLGGILLLGGFGPWDRVLGSGDVVGAALPWICWVGAVAAIVVGQTAIASPHTVTLATANGRVSLPPLTSRGATSVLHALRVAQGSGG
jgi:hypothetical protein